MLITPLKMEVQEYPEARSLCVNISDQDTGKHLDNVHIKAIGIGDSQFKSGETDLRGIWKTENVTSRPTVIARDDKGRYAFYRSQTEFAPLPAQLKTREAEIKNKPDFKGNLKEKQIRLNQDNNKTYDKMRRSKDTGVKAKKVLKK